MKKKNPKQSRYYQSVIMELTDGRIIKFSGPAQVWPVHASKGVCVRPDTIQFTNPKPMPKGTSWGKL